MGLDATMVVCGQCCSGWNPDTSLCQFKPFVVVALLVAAARNENVNTTLQKESEMTETAKGKGNWEPNGTVTWAGTCHCGDSVFLASDRAGCHLWRHKVVSKSWLGLVKHREWVRETTFVDLDVAVNELGLHR